MVDLDLFNLLLVAQEAADPNTRRNLWYLLFGVNWVDIVKSLGTAVGAYLTFKLARDQFFVTQKSKDKETSDTLQLQYLKNIQDEYRDLRVQHNVLQKLVLDLQHEVSAMRAKVAYYEENKLASQARDMLKHILNSRHTPMWIHDIGSNKCYVNNEYASFFSIDRQDFWTPVNILARFPDTAIGEMLSKELSVISAGVPMTFEEFLRKDIMNPDSPYKVKVSVRRSPLRVAENNYIFGEIIQILEHDIT